MTAVPTPQITADKPVQRWEWLVIFGVVLVAASLRFCLPSRLAVEHFDEGVYASNIWFGDRPGGVYPAQHLYAPPMLPALIEWGFVFFGPSNSGAMWPSQLAGTVTVILLWWLGRSWFGPVAGLTAATLCAASEVHILLSRSALTDVLLGMWWVAALIALRRACDSGRWSHSLLAGYLVGMAWYTKYNGWMPLAITLGAVLARGVCCRGIWPQTRTALKSCLIAGLTAFVTWSPWLWSLQSTGGYASVMANHRQYVVGVAGWLTSFDRQWSQLNVLMSVFSPSVLGIGYLTLCAIVAWRAKVLGSDPELALQQANPDLFSTRPRMRCLPSPYPRANVSIVTAQGIVPQTIIYSILPYFTWRWTFLWVLIGLVFPVVGQLMLTIQAIILWWLWSEYRHGNRLSIRNDDLGYWLAAVWFAGLLVATPLYRPYLRLTLPWLLAGYCGVGLAFHLAWTSAWCELCSFNSYRFLARWTIARGILCLLFLGFGWGITHPRYIRDGSRPAQTIPLTDQTAFTEAARVLAEKIKTEAQRIGMAPIHAAVYVYAEPGLLFQLRNAGLQNVGPVGSLQFVRTQFTNPELKVYLAVGVHAKADPQFVEQFAKVRNQLKQVGSWPWQLGPLTALDQPNCDPRKLGHNPVESATIELYEVERP